VRNLIDKADKLLGQQHAARTLSGVRDTGIMSGRAPNCRTFRADSR
jgi:hypothetical protein